MIRNEQASFFIIGLFRSRDFSRSCCSQFCSFRHIRSRSNIVAVVVVLLLSFIVAVVGGVVSPNLTFQLYYQLGHSNTLSTRCQHS